MLFATFLKYLLVVLTAFFVALGVSIWLTPEPEPCAAYAAPREGSPLAHTPHLRAHAADLVVWQPWGDAAFERARRENKPVLLSSDFASCYWGEVMRDESFRNPAVAQYINRNFVPVLLDRDEYPDVDRFYMNFVRATTGNAAWPLTVVLTPSGHAFFGGSYFPPRDTYASAGLKTVLEDVRKRWALHRPQIEHSAREMHEIMRAQNAPALSAENVTKTEHAFADAVFAAAQEAFDPEAGDFDGAPRLVHTALIDFLLHEARRVPDTPRGERARAMATFTLESLARSALQDHLGGGFFSCCADRFWRRPRTMKPLVLQAQLADLFLDAGIRQNNAFLKAVGCETVDYVCRELRAPNGLLYSRQFESAARADGASYYGWSAREIDAALPAEDARRFRLHFGVADGEECAFLTQESSLEETATRMGESPESARAGLERSAKTLLALRARRPAPDLDKKAVCAENALMLSALLRAFDASGDAKYRGRALSLLASMRAAFYDEKTGGLRRFHDAQSDARIPGRLDDYAFVVAALLDLHENEGIHDSDTPWLDWAQKLQAKQDELFGDRAGGGWFSTQAAPLSGWRRITEPYDGATASAASVAVVNLKRLARLTHNPALAERAKSIVAHGGREILRNPLATAGWARAEGHP